MGLHRTCLGSWRADVFHALDAADAAVGNFSTGHSYVVPETPLSIKPAARAYKEYVIETSGGDSRTNVSIWPRPLKRWLRMCSRMAAKLMNSSEESSMGSAVYFSKSVFTENLDP